MLWLKFVPRVLASRVLGLFERVPLPRALRGRLYGIYIRKFGVDMGEAEHPVEHYRSFNDFFIRKLRPGLRPVDGTPGSIVSPVDGRIVAFGKLDRGRILQAKGLDYSLEELVVDPSSSGSLVGGSFLTIYLAPGDYHRIHSPVAGNVRFSIHVPGTLWPVNDAAAHSIRDLFIKNERLVTGIETEGGTVLLVKIGAFNVGSIRAVYDPAAGRGRRRRFRAYAIAPRFEQGDEIARFEMGSSVVLLLPRGYQLLDSLAAGARVRVGEAVGRRTVDS